MFTASLDDVLTLDAPCARVALEALLRKQVRRMLPVVKARGLPVPAFPPAVGERDGSVRHEGRDVPFMRCARI
jgi:hypothetical protein